MLFKIPCKSPDISPMSSVIGHLLWINFFFTDLILSMPFFFFPLKARSLLNADVTKRKNKIHIFNSKPHVLCL